MELYVIRHGKTDWNAQLRFQGAKDIDLNEEGRQAARDLSARLEPVHFDTIYASPLNRAYETACILKGNRDIPLIKDQAIIEISFGEMEGVPHDQWMDTDHPRKYFFSAPDKYEPPKGGETFQSACQRTKKFVQTVLEPIHTKNPDARIMIVAHGAILSAMMCYLENRTLANFWGPGLKGNCEETIYNFDGKNWTLVSENKAQLNQYVAYVESKKKANNIIQKDDENSAHLTAQVLQQGGVVIIPTDTVYGFSGIVSNPNTSSAKTDSTPTDAKIREIKGRSETKPLIQLIAAPEELHKYTNDSVPPQLLAKWPGALTIIVHLKPELIAANTPNAAPTPTVAFRCPGDSWLRKVISLTGSPIYSTSVNRSGQPVLDEIDAIKAEFASQADLIVADGDKKGALPSTLVSIENGEVKVLRQGSVIL